MIVGNRITEVGDILYIKTDVPAIGLLALLGFTDVTDGENASSFFSKQFRYSKDGITWSEWIDLTVTNIQSVEVQPDDTLLLEYKYVGSGNNTTNPALTSVTVSASIDPTKTCGQYFQSSIFSEFFSCTDLEVLTWYLNVTEKLYKTGVLATYIDRFNENQSSEDFIYTWKSISKFFAYFVVYARKWSEFHTNPKIVDEYIQQRNLVTSPSNTPAELDELMSTLPQQFRSRGTQIPFLPQNGKPDGEVLRAIQYEKGDEFIINLYKPEHFGWNIDNCSPLFRGLEDNQNANKWYEQNYFDSFAKYPLINPTGVSLQEIDQKNQIVLNGSSGATGFGNGLGFIPIDSDLDYEMVITVKLSTGANITLGMDSYDLNGTLIQNRSYINGNFTNKFLEYQSFPRADKYYTIRCTLYNYRKSIFSGGTLNINAGNRLILDKESKSVIPFITVQSGTAYIKDIQFIPLFTEYERANLDVQNFVSIWADNKNQRLTRQELENWIRHYQLPYNSHVKLTENGEFFYNDIEEVLDPLNVDFEWLPLVFSCEYSPI